MAMLSAPDEQTIRALGTDDQGRLHGAPALALLLGEMVSLTGQNTWQRADTAVADADKPTITLHVRAHSAGGPGPTTFAYDRDVQIPLVARERQPA
ncbi:MAG: hypothetical protein LC798_12075 [Chloroflexi bacterium]|nr:hypothetical protein [Chloroflexota bacterium]